MKYCKESRQHLINIENARDYFSDIGDYKSEKLINSSELWRSSSKGEFLQDEINELKDIVRNLTDSVVSIEEFYKE